MIGQKHSILLRQASAIQHALLRVHPQIWRAIFMQNAHSLLPMIDSTIQNLAEFKVLLENQDSVEIERLLAHAKMLRDTLEGLMKERLNDCNRWACRLRKKYNRPTSRRKVGLSLSEFRFDVSCDDAFIHPSRGRSDECAYANQASEELPD